MPANVRNLVFASLVILGSGQLAAAATSATLTVTGSEQPGDSGTITVSFDGYSESILYGPYSSTASIAAALAGMFSRDYTASLCAHAAGSTISITSKNGADLGAISVTGSTSSFQINTSGWPSSLPTSSMTLSSSNPSTTTGAVVTFTATVTSGATGTVTFFDGDIPIGTAGLSGNTATLSTSSLSVGAHVIKAAYSGDTNYGSDISTPLTETISLAPEACTISSLDSGARPHRPQLHMNEQNAAPKRVLYPRISRSSQDQSCS